MQNYSPEQLLNVFKKTGENQRYLISEKSINSIKKGGRV